MVSNLADILEKDLSEIIRVISERYDIKPYIKNPDFLEERLKKWHQFGLINHTKRVKEAFLNKLNPLLKDWGVYEDVQTCLEEEVENIKKKDLFEISIPLHDLGKIISYGNKKINRNHEALSKDLIYDHLLESQLKSFSLSDRQIDYIANCVLVHDIIGKEIRDELHHEGKLSLKYIPGKYTKYLCEKVSIKYANMKTELGIFFLCDSIGKTDIEINANTDKEIIQQELKIIKTLKERGLPLKLKYAVMQLPLTIKLAEVYLRNIFDE